ncbi:hypothetical protein TVAG_283030 [Trichomonas vaginalis G3]|uniref:Nucleoplasmin-like domain-containing protein n=1 Tax=Trichomonas vaginalis (strain ATCC PRA-98 / G3) TaxID=412133 RepID=A2DEK6_TRIV3|nr:nucleoplasmin core domain domain-containing protein [Trichomonas vaginalis G3]EAY21133.1 hypothetical protein TVAG_283030 [Trichomonas vaginalis G3]KAI5522342.1 nucleoplasmin core domain domain-containing protein [Trichomonas vaginalis G3]|eukprot:XP_001582119.1 hypothetical protein [Trichomonas vaginalis G3]
MLLPDNYSTVWTTIISSEKPCTVKVSEHATLHITNLCVGREEYTPQTGRLVLYAKVNDQDEVALIPFTLGSFESSQVDFNFNEGDVIVFTVKGAKASVHASGFLTGLLAIDIENAREPLIKNEVKEEEK